MRYYLFGLAALIMANVLRADAPNVAPTLALSRTNVAYVAGSGPVLLDEQMLVSDPDSPNFDAGALTVSFGPEAQPEDRLGIRNQGAGPGNIFTSGQTVSYAIQPIGTFVGGTNGRSPLVITLNGKATAEAVQALARSLTYDNANTATRPTPGLRRIELRLSDGDGGISSPVYLEARVGPSNRPPVAIATFSPRILLFAMRTNGVVLSRNNWNALVVLDGSLSSDVDHDPLSYAWFEETHSAPFARGIRATSKLTVGTHALHLRVSDGQLEGETSFVVEVVTLGEAVEGIIRRLVHSPLPRQRWQPLMATLKTADAALERGQWKSAAHHLETLRNKIRAQIEPTDSALARELLQSIENLLGVLRGP